jgi:hypothetical protein
MQVITMPRKPKPKRDEIKVSYRLAPEVKTALAESAETSGRSENLQVEYLLKVALLSLKNIDVSKMNDAQINLRFDSLYGGKDD